jgi:hypothetical protein
MVFLCFPFAGTCHQQRLRLPFAPRPWLAQRPGQLNTAHAKLTITSQRPDNTLANTYSNVLTKKWADTSMGRAKIKSAGKRFVGRCEWALQNE